MQHVAERLWVKLSRVWWEQPLCTVWDRICITYIAVHVHAVCRKDEKESLTVAFSFL